MTYDIWDMEFLKSNVTTIYTNNQYQLLSDPGISVFRLSLAETIFEPYTSFIHPHLGLGVTKEKQLNQRISNFA